MSKDISKKLEKIRHDRARKFGATPVEVRFTWDQIIAIHIAIKQVRKANKPSDPPTDFDYALDSAIATLAALLDGDDIE